MTSPVVAAENREKINAKAEIKEHRRRH